MDNCNHPKECLDHNGDCKWCAEVYQLQSTIDGLRSTIGKVAIVLTGDVTIGSGATIGYLEVHGKLEMLSATSVVT